jgi:hypothetical protein
MGGSSLSGLADASHADSGRPLMSDSEGHPSLRTCSLGPTILVNPNAKELK